MPPATSPVLRTASFSAAATPGTSRSPENSAQPVSFQPNSWLLGFAARPSAPREKSTESVALRRERARRGGAQDSPTELCGVRWSAARNSACASWFSTWP